MLPSDLEALLKRVKFSNLAEAQKRLGNLAGEPAETLALVHISQALGDLLAESPDPDATLIHLERFAQARGSHWELYNHFLEHPAALESFIGVVSTSNYLADVLVRNPEYLPIIYDSPLLEKVKTEEQFQKELVDISKAFHTAISRIDSIRRYRRQEILRIGAADILEYYNLQEITEQLSRLADVVVANCLGEVSIKANDSGFFVLGLGKLGGNELNYSSDIDLIFVTENIDCLDSSTQVARELTQFLGEFTAEGFLYRVDLRLRPYGSAGSLVVSTAMLEDYLATKADPAERQTMLKARPIAGDIEVANAFLQRIRPVLYADFLKARSLVRKLKERIERQLKRNRNTIGNVKLAPGGIRDIEFIVQALQLEAGHHQSKLQTGNTLEAISRLTKAEYLREADAAVLVEVYKFLRIIEHRMQMMNNRQVHQLPEDDDACLILARTLAYKGPDEVKQLREDYNEQAGKVREIFDRILPATED